MEEFYDEFLHNTNSGYHHLSYRLHKGLHLCLVHRSLAPADNRSEATLHSALFPKYPGCELRV